MTDGGIDADSGLTYWATINISGDLNKEQLNAVIEHIKNELKKKVTGDGSSIGTDGTPIEGEIKQAVRVSGGKSAELGPPISIGLKKGTP